MIDYKELLKKYIHHIGGSEGIDFIPKRLGEPRSIRNSNPRTSDPFTMEEVKALWECSGWDEENKRYEDTI